MTGTPGFTLDVTGDISYSGNLRMGQTNVLINSSRVATLAAIRAGGGSNPSGNIVASFYGLAAEDPNLSAISGFARFGVDGQNSELVIGASSAALQPIWIQGKNRNHTGQTFDIMLQPLGGKVGIGLSVSTFPSYALQLGADSAAKPTTNTWTVPASDARTKRNVKDLVGGLEIIKRLRPIEAEFNGLGGTQEGQRLLGFIAQEIREVLPGTVGSRRGKLHPDDEEETDILDFNLHEVLIHLVLAVKQLAARVPPATA